MDERQGRLVADYVYRELSPDDVAMLRSYMVQGRDAEGLSAAYCDLGEVGMCVPCKPPFTEADVRRMLAMLGEARIHHRMTAMDWGCMLRGAFGSRASYIGSLYEKATGISDSLLFTPTPIRLHRPDPDIRRRSRPLPGSRSRRWSQM